MPWVSIIRSSADVGLCHWQNAHGSHLVGLPFLDSRFSQPQLRSSLVSDRSAADHDLFIGGCRQCRRWLDIVIADSPWLERESGRKTAMLISALAVVPVVFAARASSLTVAVLLIGLAAAAHQGWSANIFTLVSDMFPTRAVGSVVGFGGMFGAIGGMVIAKFVGYVLEWTGSYVPIFILAGSAYLIALLVIHILVPQMRPAMVESER